jgi:hypothetical protein
MSYAAALSLSCDAPNEYACPAPPLPALGADIDYLAAVGGCCESLASLTARVGRPVPVWNTCTGSVGVNPMDNLRHEVVVQELAARIAGNVVRPPTCVSRANAAAGADDYGGGGGGASSGLSCRGLLCSNLGGSSVATLVRGPVTTSRRSNTVAAIGCRTASCGNVYGWVNAGPSTVDSSWAAGPTAVVNGTSSQGCGLLGQGGFRY